MILFKFCVATMLTVLAFKFPYLRRKCQRFLCNNNLWATLAVIFCSTMVSGQMWNQIRGPPMMQKTKYGTVYIRGHPSSQYVAESYIVAVLNAIVVAGMVLIIESAGGAKNRKPRVLGSMRRRFQSVVGLVLVCVFFSLLVSIYISKNKGYPYSFLIK